MTIPLAGSCTGTYQVDATLTLGGAATSPTVDIVGGVSGVINCPGGSGPISAAINSTENLTLGGACPGN